ncbi:MAG TPA: 2-phosphosulfolactate phosphatase [Candidatus Binatus sp.]|nr:2-phosphosulfolactate phosphatase [Candidatus Binatus sp.]
MPSVAIDCFREELASYPAETVIVGVDVIRSTTTATTCVASGRRCFVVPTLEEAVRWQRLVEGAILVGELGGNMPFGFDLNNSPAAILGHPRAERPAILLSSSGTRLLTEASAHHRTLVACLRNWEAVAAELLNSGAGTVVLLGAATRGEFREEDQLCCAWIGARLVEAGFRADAETARVIDRWRAEPAARIVEGASARYLRESGQDADLAFILEHVADLPEAFVVVDNEVTRLDRPGAPEPGAA